MSLPEYNVSGQDYSQRGHLRKWPFPVIDIHAHVTMTNSEDRPEGPAGGAGEEGSSEAAHTMLTIGHDFGVAKTYSMCPAQDIPPLRKRFGSRIGFNGMLNKKPDEPDDAAYRNLDRFLENGVEIIKLWSAPRGRERGLVIDAPWRIEGLKRARAAGIKVVMCHVGDPDVWWTHTYKDLNVFGTKASHYEPLGRMLEMFPDMQWIGAHMGGDPEHPDHLEAMLERYPHLSFDTSATKWQVREVSRRNSAIRSLICRYPDRFLFGTDLVTRHRLVPEHYVSRYWCQFTLWESNWEGQSPIADSDYIPGEGEGPNEMLRGVGLPDDVLEKVYWTNAQKLLKINLTGERGTSVP